MVQESQNNCERELVPFEILLGRFFEEPTQNGVVGVVEEQQEGSVSLVKVYGKWVVRMGKLIWSGILANVHAIMTISMSNAKLRGSAKSAITYHELFFQVKHQLEAITPRAALR